MDEQIIERLRAGDTEGVTLLQMQYGPMVRYIVRGILRDAQDAEECVSDVWLRVWQKCASFDPEKGTLAAWVTAVARNAAVDRLRRRRAPDEAFDEQDGASPSPDDEVLRRERTRQLQRTVDALGAAEQQLFCRKYYLSPVHRADRGGNGAERAGGRGAAVSSAPPLAKSVGR